MRIAAGVAAAATIGVLVGPAALSIGFRASQIPEEDRGKLQTHGSSLTSFCIAARIMTAAAIQFHRWEGQRIERYRADR
jgi:hypothetical protein